MVIASRVFGRLLIALAVTVSATGTGNAQSAPPPIVANTNVTPAGQLVNGRLTLRLEAAMGQWLPEESDGPSLPVAAFREAGGSLSAPGPLVRVVEGTQVVVSITNRLERPLTVHGIHSRPGDAKDALVIAPEATVETSFVAGSPGTYFYWASRTGAATTSLRRRDDGQLNGAFIVDSRNASRERDHIFMITDWIAIDDDTVSPPRRRELFTINGRSWPHTERLTYRAGENVQWRVINAATSNHPLHLHGFFFRVDAVGDAESHTTYTQDQRRSAVTELVRPGRTFSLTWTPERAGNWLFHCHVLPHTSPQQRFWKPSASSSGHDMADHAQDGMAGLVVGVTILPDATSEAAATPRAPTRTIGLTASPMPGYFGAESGMGFLVEEPGATPRPSIPGPPLVLTQGQTTAINVTNRLAEPLAVHWHGVELESFYDGVPGVSGAGARVMQPIAPGRSFMAQFTPPRAGTFIYHSHFDDLKQLSSGLYGPLIVLPPGQTFDADRERVLVISRAGPGETPIWLNGSRAPAMGAMKAGRTYRLRIINIVPENPPVDVRLTSGGTPLMWRPIAKDGGDLPAGQRALTPGRLTIAVGETYDFEVTPVTGADVLLEVTRPGNSYPPEFTPSGKTVELRPASGVAVTVPVEP